MFFRKICIKLGSEKNIFSGYDVIKFCKWNINNNGEVNKNFGESYCFFKLE